MSSVPSDRLGASKRRLGLAREAARIIALGQSPDYQSAKRKALKNLGLPSHTPLPRNQDIEVALLEHQRLFGDQRAGQHLAELRRGALVAMRELEAFKPRLTGAVLRGGAALDERVCLHLFAETVEEVAVYLMDRGIPFRHIEQRLELGAGKKHRIPGYGLVADGVAFELLVFSGAYRHRTPICPVAGRAMQRASADDVQSLLDSGSEDSWTG